MAIITISRGTFSGGKALAECVAEKLKCKCISREVLREAARRHGVPLDELSKAISDKPGILERVSLARSHYHAYIREALVEAIKDEDVVYHGLAGHLLLRDVPHVLRVKVIANIEYRIRSAMERTNLTRADAIEFIKQIDRKRDRWVRFMYHVDRNDPSTYDLVVNLDRLSISTACDIVALNAGLPEYQSTPESRKRIADLVLATEIRAKIAAANIIDDREIEIEANDGAITIKGKVQNLVDADRVHELLRDLPEVRSIQSKLQVKDYSYTLV